MIVNWEYNAWPSGEPYDWLGCKRESEFDTIDFHLDLGCGTLKKGRIGIDRWPSPGVNIVLNMAELDGPLYLPPFVDNVMAVGEDADVEQRWSLPTKGQLPFHDSTIRSIISHHFFEHLASESFIRMVDEVYRVLEPDAIARIITPAWPSRVSMGDPDHKMMICEDTWRTFEGFPDNHWHSAFSVPYMKARFEILDLDITPMLPPEERWTEADAREIRVALKARK
jgi:SAM-dependent methyltransferase